MLNIVLTLLVVAIVAGIFGFGVVAAAATGIAQVLFLLSLVLFVISVSSGVVRGTHM